MKKPTVLMILDGFGLSKETRNNAIAQAKKPNIDRLMKTCPFTEGQASGASVSSRARTVAAVKSGMSTGVNSRRSHLSRR